VLPATVNRQQRRHAFPITNAINIIPYVFYKRKSPCVVVDTSSFISPFPCPGTRADSLLLKVLNKLNRRLCQIDKGGPNLITFLTTFLLKNCFFHAKTNLGHCPGNTLFNHDKCDFQHHPSNINTNRCDFLW